MPGILLGVESEYALSGNRHKEDLMNQLMSLMKQNIPFLRGGGDWDLFLENGARFYVDYGCHPEMSTPECRTPTELVRYILAGERILADLVEKLPPLDSSPSEVLLFRCNVDYSGAKTTWGSHESYLYQADSSIFPRQLIPHLASRVIYAGAGGFNPLSPGVEFTLSPRAWHLKHIISNESTHNRGIFHTKNESLSRTGTHRLHLLCGESLCSQIASWLRIGTTALIVAMIDAGLEPGTSVELAEPLTALKAFVSDPTCKATAELKDGRRLNAIDIQRHFLDKAESKSKDKAMPPWAEKVCRQWRIMLDRLENGPDSVSETLDWAIKYAIYKDYVTKKSIQWDDFPHWNHIVDEIKKALKKSEHKGMASVELVLGKEKKKSPIPKTIEKLGPFLDKYNLSWEMLRPFVDLRKELFEMDIRFGQLGNNGIFNMLDRAGVVSHQAPGIKNATIEQAKTRPPVSSRARLRGESVRALAGSRYHQCYWDSIWDSEKKRLLDLTDPFETKIKWRKFSDDEDMNAYFGRRSRRRARPELDAAGRREFERLRRLID